MGIVNQTNLKDVVAAHIRENILSGTVRAGEKIDQDQLAHDLGVSKLPVREALIQLASEGLVDNRARRGAYVSALEPDDVLDHYQVYGLVSGVAAHRAATRMSEEEIDQLESILLRMDATSDAAELEALNTEFHRRINVAGASGRLLAILKTLSYSLPGAFYEFAEGWEHEARKHHWDILEAIKSRDGEETAGYVASHLAAGGKFAVGLLEGRGFWNGDK